MAGGMSSATRFVGSIPALYDRHLGPVLFEPYARDLRARLPPGTSRVLESAAGTGRVTRQLVAALGPDGHLLATDLNDAMLAVARAQLDDPRVAWRQADAQALPVDDGSFDVVVCQFGLMFMPEPVCVLAEMRRALRPGGTLLLNTWDQLARNPASAVLHAHATAAFPTDPPDFMLTPFAMHDPLALRDVVVAAGFAEVRVDTVAAVGEAASAADLAIGFARGNPLWHQLVARFGDRPCRSALSAHVVTAVA
jgi:SAM-dependent methyltransferase